MAAPHKPQPPTVSSPLTDDSTQNANTGSKKEVCMTCGGGSDGSLSIYTRVRGRPIIQILAMLLCRPVVDVDTGPGDGHVCSACLVKFDVVMGLLERLVAVSREFAKGYYAALKLRRPNKRQLEDKYDGWVEEDECLLVVEGMLVEDNQAGIVSRALAMANTRPKKETKKRRYECTVCGKVFAAYSHRVEHMMVHTHERNFPCDLCDYNATTRSNLTKHRKIHTNPVTCTICHKQLSNKFALKEHMNLHTKEKSHQCSHCHKVFWRRQDKRLHERTHQSDGWYSCPTCSKSFVVKSRLARHMLTHQSIKQFECEVCHKKFSRKDDLLCHARIHTGERPYVCVVCGRQFRFASNCRNHRRTHTRGQDPFSCAICNLTFPSQAKHTTHLKSKNHKKKMSEVGVSEKTVDKVEKIPESDGTEHIFCQLCKMSYSLTDYALHKPLCSDKILESVEQLSNHTLQSVAESSLTHTLQHTLTLSADQTMEHTLTHASDHTITHTDHALADSLTHTTENGIMLSDYTGIILPLDKLTGETHGVNVVVTVKADSSPLHHNIISAPSSTTTTGFSTSSTTSNSTSFSITNPAFTTTSTPTNTTTVLKNTIPTTTDFSKTTNRTTSTTTDFPIINTATNFTTPNTILKTTSLTNTTIIPISLGPKPGVTEGEAMSSGVLTEISDVEAAAEGSQSPSRTTISIHNPATEFKISDWEFQHY